MLAYALTGHGITGGAKRAGYIRGQRVRLRYDPTDRERFELITASPAPSGFEEADARVLAGS